MTVLSPNPQAGSKRGQILEHVRENYVGRSGDMAQVREELMRKFGVSKAYLYQMTPEMKQIIGESRRSRAIIPRPEEASLPEPVAENGHFELPPDLNQEGLAAVMGLLNKIGSLEQEAVGKQAEFATVQGTLFKTNKTVGMLKDLVHKLVDAL
jgi:hypothetical protein